MKIVFTFGPPNSYSLFDVNNDEIVNNMLPNISLSLFGKSFIPRKLSILNSIYGIESIIFPKSMSLLKSLIRSKFKNLPIIETDEEIINCDRDYEGNSNGNAESNNDRTMANNYRITNLNDKSFFDSFAHSKITNVVKANSQHSDLDLLKTLCSQVIPVYNNELILMNPCNTIIGSHSTKYMLESFKVQQPWEFLDITLELLSMRLRLPLYLIRPGLQRPLSLRGHV